MAKINLPKEILGKESFKTLPAKEKEEYMKNLLKNILKLNPDGVTISQIKDDTGFTYSTIWHHLEVLSCVAQGRKISHGNLDVYYPIGNVSILAEYLHTKGKARYIISKLENEKGNFVGIHEKRQNKMGNYTICKGIAIPVELIDVFVKAFNKVKKDKE